jgi:hypothetical protein
MVKMRRLETKMTMRKKMKMRPEEQNARPMVAK